MEERLRKIMADVFLLDVNEIDVNSSPDSIPQWDSIGHLNLVTAIEEEFGIKIDDEQITQMLNFKLVAEIVKESMKG
jgi:acyl carrier protein